MIDNPDNFPIDTRNAALALIRQYGPDAQVIAMLRAAEFAALGDVDGLAAWDDIIACIEAYDSLGPVGGVVH
ncbi:MAG: hypothetical protein Q8L59_07760 [Phenylobacterium sp.]|jgi:hypothetical protein|uniref:hypothetical protein n=1 Tax=Caulobacteraceae TaxID=76892 RepID=UPI0027376C16|nr:MULTISPECIES: hypothetical protein [Caulobacteraceae]MBU2134713.1 hypothetical protein [Alphaproteobacteria bacterium]MBW0151314.1 hypothetical protein [Phenylobacterium sp.]MDP1642066.1 hypothetical protein [Phenylobacterium sp.]MDP3117464.1 hypothetical protein [Phenylobacterium sp.]MDP3384975.1 hypothetical protein [Phenylobacterium sp.]